MSLQVWLPLNGDLKNQGLNEATPTGTAFSSNDNGKIGKCIKTTSSGVIDLKYSGSQINNGSISFGGWFKFNKDEINTIVSPDVYTYTSTYATSSGNLIGNHSYGGIGLIWQTNNIYTDKSFNTIRVFGALRSTKNSARSTNGFNIPFDTWVHLFVVFNKNTKILQLWENGNLKYSNSMVDFDDAIARNLYINYNAIFAGNAHACNIPFLVNDVRIYDHALSLKEIKEISKGLIVHYPLDDKYIESTTNLITGEDCLSATCYNGAISKYGYGTNTDMYKQVTTFDGRKGTKVYNKIDGGKMYPYVYINNMFTSNGTNSPEYKTLSFDYYTNKSTSICPYKLGSGTGTATYIVTNTETKTGTGTNSVTIPIKPNMWNHIEITFHGTTDADSQWGYIQNQPSHTSDTSNFWFFANMQLETKDHATGYAGVGKTRTSTTVYDVSGYGNDGTLVGNFECNTDTPRYGLSTYAKGGASTYLKGIVLPKEAKTVSLWIKSPKNVSSAIFNDKTTGLQIGLLNSLLYVNALSSTTPFTTTNWKDDDWNHVVVINDNNVRSCYINGQAETQSGNNNYYVHNANEFWVWNRSYNNNYPFVGCLSDLRIYVTALSEEDIKNLYEVTASADADNNYYVYSYDELAQKREIEFLYDLQRTSSSTGLFTQDTDGLHLNDFVWVYHDYVPINPTGKTYKYDITYSCDAGNQFYIGWERYDANKTSRSNSACVYVISTKPSMDVVMNRVKGTVNLSTDGVNPCAFIKLRILNKWTGSDSDTNGTATIHSFSLKEYSSDNVLTPLNHTKQGIVNTTEIIESDIGVSINDTYELKSNNFYEI